jgi:hypothetical protein
VAAAARMNDITLLLLLAVRYFIIKESY